jgi:hypothetical protein
VALAEYASVERSAVYRPALEQMEEVVLAGVDFL